MNNSYFNFENAYVYLLIELKPESSKVNKNESEKFLTDTWLAIPEFSPIYENKNLRETCKYPKSYQYKNLRKTFESNRTYTQAEIEENFSNLITECNQKID